MEADYEKVGKAFVELVKVVKALRTPETGCPWDLEQDHMSLRPYVIEEAYEVVQAIEQEDDKELCDELGDVLLQSVLHAQVAQDRDAFDIVDVVKSITDKMIRRHPHVFGDSDVKDSAEVLRNWEQIKREEKQADSKEAASYAEGLAKIPEQLPALLKAQRLGEKTAKINFDWPSIDGVIEKVREEFSELDEEIRSNKPDDERKSALQHELGDVLFSICQLARWLGVGAEDSLRMASARFVKRFGKLEELSTQPLETLSIDELEELWQKAKVELGE